uniref:rho-related BTB domain-containing protein 2 n=1 Tax=Pristiophorus japonicus TaxID=55135 RepID=UPI00398E6600
MAAMFRGSFIESYSNKVPLPSSSSACVRTVLEFLYTGQLVLSPQVDAIELIVLADRLCLPRLIALTEQFAVDNLLKASAEGIDIDGFVLQYLEKAQLHSAGQLADWCLHHICTNYNSICRKFPKEMRHMSAGNQAHFEKWRWPPVWYLKEDDRYQRAEKERQREEQLLHKQHAKRKWCFWRSSTSSVS